MAALADQYDLTHNSGWGSVRSAGCFRDSATGQVSFSAGAVRPEVGARMSGWNDMEKVCHFCHKKGHVKADCYALQKRNKQMSVKPPAFAASVMCVSDMPDVHKEVPVVAYLPFVSSGYISLSGPCYNSKTLVHWIHSSWRLFSLFQGRLILEIQC